MKKLSIITLAIVLSILLLAVSIAPPSVSYSQERYTPAPTQETQEQAVTPAPPQWAYNTQLTLCSSQVNCFNVAYSRLEITNNSVYEGALLSHFSQVRIFTSFAYPIESLMTLSFVGTNEQFNGLYNLTSVQKPHDLYIITFKSN